MVRKDPFEVRGQSRVEKADPRESADKQNAAKSLSLSFEREIDTEQGSERGKMCAPGQRQPRPTISCKGSNGRRHYSACPAIVTTAPTRKVTGGLNRHTGLPRRRHGLFKSATGSRAGNVRDRRRMAHEELIRSTASTKTHANSALTASCTT